ncbi:MAG: hypothetical protein HQK79_11020 [Desulfobacterales bacterium]|nr:hypothetical protein [Desulfobacterales bacterium]MBF0396953.1 hypothetical protein [Desulfobacterales bacterium]
MRKKFFDYSFLRKIRKEQKYTIKQFADWVETSISNYLRKEQGHVTITIDEIFNLFNKIKEKNPDFIGPIIFAPDQETLEIIHILKKLDINTKKNMLELLKSSLTKQQE